MIRKQGRPKLEGDPITRQRVAQIEKRAIGKLRRLMYEQGYKAEDFLDTPRKRGNKC